MSNHRLGRPEEATPGKGNPDKREGATRTVLVAVILALVGLICISVSFSLSLLKEHDYLREFLKELSIVVFAVFTVSLIYERLLAEKHLKGFVAILRDQIERTDANAAACTELGIVRIFPSRDLLENFYPLEKLLWRPGPDNHSRFVALSLFHLMKKANYLKQAMAQRGSIELCLLNPELSEEQPQKVPDLVLDDIRSAITVFGRDLATWIKAEKPLGRLELRFHNSPVPESFASFLSPTERLGLWDLRKL